MGVAGRLGHWAFLPGAQPLYYSPNGRHLRALSHPIFPYDGSTYVQAPVGTEHLLQDARRDQCKPLCKSETYPYVQRDMARSIDLCTDSRRVYGSTEVFTHLYVSTKVSMYFFQRNPSMSNTEREKHWDVTLIRSYRLAGRSYTRLRGLETAPFEPVRARCSGKTRQQKSQSLGSGTQVTGSSSRT